MTCPSHHATLELRKVVFGHAREVIDKHGFTMADVASSFGVQSAGALTLHNFPNAFREIELPNGHVLDLAAVDILRDRERGVPRYNDLRRQLHRPAVRSFEELNRQWASAGMAPSKPARHRPSAIRNRKNIRSAVVHRLAVAQPT